MFREGAKSVPKRRICILMRRCYRAAHTLRPIIITQLKSIARSLSNHKIFLVNSAPFVDFSPTIQALRGSNPPTANFFRLLCSVKITPNPNYHSTGSGIQPLSFNRYQNAAILVIALFDNSSHFLIKPTFYQKVHRGGFTLSSGIYCPKTP